MGATCYEEDSSRAYRDYYAGLRDIIGFQLVRRKGIGRRWGMRGDIYLVEEVEEE